MKIITIILAAYVGFISVNPILVKFNDSKDIVSQEFCLNTCSEEEPECETACAAASADKNEKSCFPEEGCTYCTCGLYCFCGLVDAPYHQLTSPEGLSNLKKIVDHSLISNYFSDCFRPPEV